MDGFFGVLVEAFGCERDVGGGVRVLVCDVEHELVGCVRVRVWDFGVLLEVDQCDRCV